MNKLMILAILVAYKAFNNKSLTIVVKECEGEYVVNNVVIDSIGGDNISFLSWTNTGVYCKTVNANGDVYCKTIYIDDIIGIQFTDKRAVVGMK